MTDIIEDIDRTLRRYGEASPLLLRGQLVVAKQEIQALRTAVENLTVERTRLAVALEELVLRCDGDEGIRKDGENIDTRHAHAALGHFDEGESE